MCWGHYLRLRRHGDPLKGGTTNGAPRAFLDAALASDTDECIVWPFARDANGYARFRHNGENIPAYRVVCEEAHGPPVGIENHATHNCGKGNLGCINPNHLEWGTRFKNQQDRVEHGTSNRGEQCAAHKLTTEQVVVIFARLNAGERPYQLGPEYEVSPATIRDIKFGLSWAWLTGMQNPKERDRMGRLVAANDNDKVRVAA
jgi:hypothetical protein